MTYDIQKNADRLQEYLEDLVGLSPNTDESRVLAYNFAAMLPVVVSGTSVPPEHIVDGLVGVEPTEDIFGEQMQQQFHTLFSSILGSTPSADVDPFQKLQSEFQEVMNPVNAVKLDPVPWVRRARKSDAGLPISSELRSRERVNLNWEFSPRAGFSQDPSDYKY